MIRKTALTIAAAAAISAAAMGATTSSANAGFKVHVHGPGIHLGHGWGHGGYYNPCRRWLKKYRWTGKYRYLRKYRCCMRWHY